VRVRDPYGLLGPGRGIASEGLMTIDDFMKAWERIGNYGIIYDRSKQAYPKQP